MIRHFCDRCGEEIKTTVVVLTWQVDCPPYYSDGDGRMELCDDCCDDFMGWMYAKRMDKCEAAGAE